MSVSTATHLRQACENSREPRSVGEILSRYSELRANHPVTTQFAQVGCEEHEVEVGTYVPTQQEMDFLAELIR